MSSFDEELLELLKEEKDIKTLLLENEQHNADLFFALSPQRSGLLSWFDFDQRASLLQVGAEHGAMTGLFMEKCQRVVVADGDRTALDVLSCRHGRKNAEFFCGTISDVQKKGGRFEYIYFAEPSLLDEETARAARAMLKPHGVIMAAAANTFGIKYIQGTKRPEKTFERGELCGLLTGGLSEWEAEVYYPTPDHRVPTNIYSDDYLPGTGDLSHIPPAYDYPIYHVGDMAGEYDLAVKCGRFKDLAPSYLVLVRRLENIAAGREKKIYIRNNSLRRDAFKTSTAICEKKSASDHALGRQVKKAALCDAGWSHIRSITEKRRKLSVQHVGITPAPVSISAEGAVFPYLSGKTWARILAEETAMGQDMTSAVLASLAALLDVGAECRHPFKCTKEFEEVFGGGLLKEDLEAISDDTSLNVSNIDALFENVMYTASGENIFLDYEWVFDFPVPESFIKYRVIHYFCEQMRAFVSAAREADLLAAAGIDGARTEIFARMEEAFQAYVHGDEKKIYLDDYMVWSRGPEEMRQTESDLARARERVEQLKIHSKEKDAQIRKMTEIKRLTDNHVTNLEAIIRDQKNEIAEQEKLIVYLKKHESLPFRVKRKLGDLVRKRYPAGSMERKRLKYRLRFILHPVEFLKSIGNAEAANLKKGDFEIGDAYPRHGRLHFAGQESPTVSIVIPVYNQIAYTYACLVSILENTADVSYEVIIADDVSTDATEHLREYADGEGLKIIRNANNQGFLRNCNHAAESAVGKYILFLNNDTKVCPGWLSSLVELLESDETIGMAGSKLVYPDGRLQEAGGIVWSDGSAWNYGRLDDPEKPDYNYVRDVDYISGASIILKRSLWEEIGGFDERYAPAYCEDSDLAFEVRKRGLRVVYQPLSRVIHFEGVSNGTDVNGSGLKKYQVENAKKLREKWAAELALQFENTGSPDPFRARERSRGKKIVLVVDHYVPTWDKDAGSKTTYQYIKMFLKKGYVVKFLGDNFAHEEPYSTVLEQMGVEILYGPYYQVHIWDWLKDHGDELCAVYLNRPHIASKYIDYILDNTPAKVIYYGHDLHFLRESREYRITGDEKLKESAKYWKSVELMLMSKAEVSYYPSCVERDAIREIDPTINVKAITAYVFDSFKRSADADFAKRKGIMFVGGFAHPPNADAVKWFVEEIYPEFRELAAKKGIEDVPFYIVGSKATDEILALDGRDGVVVKGFVTEEELGELYETTRIVVVPLRYGAGVKGKVVEALYNGAAVVTTSVGTEGMPGVEEAVLTADDPEAFAKVLADAYGDEELLRKLSAGALAYARSHYSVDAAWQTIAEDF